jgi:hypothetical protein
MTAPYEVARGQREVPPSVLPDISPARGEIEGGGVFAIT